ncbi:MAG TPA: chemotaxis protein CheB [Planctomycetota bacterium]
MAHHRDLIVVGASAGGVDALQALVAGLPENFPAAVLVVLHSAPTGPGLMPHILSRAGVLMAVEGQDRMALQPGRIYVAPPDHHLLVSPGHVHVTKGPRENRSRPAIDPLFRTAAQHYGPRVIGVIMTGMLNDGTVGLLEVKRRGGIAIVQDPDEAAFPSMPLSALRYVKVDHQVRADEISSLLVRLTSEEGVTGPLGLDVPFQLAMESKFAAQETLDEIDTMDSIGALAGYSCPECHGPLWRMNGDGPIRFRCHVGHAYTAEAVLAGQAESLEANLWDVLRTLEERASLLREMAGQAREMNLRHEAADWEGRIRFLEKDMVSVRALLTNGTSGETKKNNKKTGT